MFFDRETFGADQLVVGLGPGGTDPAHLRALLSRAPVSARARQDIAAIETANIDYMPGMSSDAKKQRLSRMSYEAFLRDIVHVDPATLKYYHARTKGEWGVGTDAVSALDCWGFGLPGFQGMNLARGSISRMGFTPAGYADTGGSFHYHSRTATRPSPGSWCAISSPKPFPAAMRRTSSPHACDMRNSTARMQRSGCA